MLRNTKKDSADKAQSDAIKNEQKAAEKLERMNGIFDRLIVPMLLFTVLLIFCAGLVPKWAASCAKKEGVSAQDDIVMSQTYSFYSKRAELLADIGAHSDIYEQHGYVLVDDDDAGVVAYRRLDSSTEIMDNLIDQNGNRYSVVVRKFGDISVTLMIYSRSAFLAVAQSGEDNWSAVLGSENFAETSSGDAKKLFLHVTAQQLTELLEEYKASTQELFQ